MQQTMNLWSPLYLFVLSLTHNCIIIWKVWIVTDQRVPVMAKVALLVRLPCENKHKVR